MGNNSHEFLYKLHIITGLALIPIEITADSHIINGKTGMIEFESYRKGYNGKEDIAWYPIVSTIISEKVDNPEYRKIIGR